jgi:hypothetical protein
VTNVGDPLVVGRRGLWPIDPAMFRTNGCIIAMPNLNRQKKNAQNHKNLAPGKCDSHDFDTHFGDLYDCEPQSGEIM